jgi:hypothetical protein
VVSGRVVWSKPVEGASVDTELVSHTRARNSGRRWYTVEAAPICVYGGATGEEETGERERQSEMEIVLDGVMGCGGGDESAYRAMTSNAAGDHTTRRCIINC